MTASVNSSQTLTQFADARQEPQARTRHLLLGVWLCLASCSPTAQDEQAKTGSQTNWLEQCSDSSECGTLGCFDGICTLACSDDAACSNFPGATCVNGTEAGRCLPPAATESELVRVDVTQQHQTLIGFGAGVGYSETTIADFKDREALLDLMFADSGFEVVRIRNTYDPNSPTLLQHTRTILDGAEQRVGHRLVTFLNSASPPDALKANGSQYCPGDPAACTLVRDTGGNFRYRAFAEHWRASIDAHVALGIIPNYLSIQNNPNWIPDPSARVEGCRFMPLEQPTSEVALPGYKQALEATLQSLAGLNAPLLVAAPDGTSAAQSRTFASDLNGDSYQLLAFHMYDTGPTGPDLAALNELRAAAQATGAVTAQTEMRAEGWTTAQLVHYALTEADAAVYLASELVTTGSESNSGALIALDTDDGAAPSFAAQAPYYALRHYARYTKPGWRRVDALASHPDILGSAWLAPDERRLTVILLNRRADAVTVNLDLGGSGASFTLDRSESTVFPELQRSTSVADSSAEPRVNVAPQRELPGQSALTLVYTR